MTKSPSWSTNTVAIQKHSRTGLSKRPKGSRIPKPSSTARGDQLQCGFKPAGPPGANSDTAAPIPVANTSTVEVKRAVAMAVIVCFSRNPLTP
jgi:hypothetical protein